MNDGTPRRLRDPSLVPSKGWRAAQEDGAIVKGSSFKDLMFRVEQYRSANGLPVPTNLRRLVEDQVCKALDLGGESNGRCKYLEEDDQKNPPELRAWNTSPRQLLNFARAAAVVVGELAKGNPVTVAAPEAEERAKVCSQCPYNINLANCYGCGELGRLFRSIQGGLSTSLDPRLHSCDRCGCNLRTKVWIKDEALARIEREQGLGEESFPEWCWRNVATAPPPPRFKQRSEV